MTTEKRRRKLDLDIDTNDLTEALSSLSTENVKKLRNRTVILSNTASGDSSAISKRKYTRRTSGISKKPQKKSSKKVRFADHGEAEIELPRTVSTTFLLASDTHSNVPLESTKTNFRLPFPKCDVFIHAGDLTQYGRSVKDFEKTLEWIQKINCELKIIIPGNHDEPLDLNRFVKDGYQENIAVNCREYLTSPQMRESGVYYLENESRQFHLSNGARFTVLATSYTPTAKEHEGGAFRHQKSTNPYKDLSYPAHVDVLVSHGPPYNKLDRVEGYPVGCIYLQYLTRTLKPKLHVFGHIHEAWGADMVAWNGYAEDNPKRTLRAENHVKEGEGQGRYIDLSDFGKAITDESNTTLMVNAAICGKGNPPTALRSVILTVLDLPYVTKNVYQGIGLRVGPIM